MASNVGVLHFLSINIGKFDTLNGWNQTAMNALIPVSLCIYLYELNKEQVGSS